MTYTLEWIKNFNGNINIHNVNMSCLANVIETYVSQYKYVYLTNMIDYPEIILSVPNSSIPHLLGLSREHHVNLPSNNAGSIFEGLKDDWTLERLQKADNGWFNENKFKIIGTLLLYQMLHLIQCKFYTTNNILNKEVVLEGKQQHMTNAIKIFCKSVFDSLNENDISLIRFPKDEL